MANTACTVLLLEDEPLIKLDLESILETEGFQVSALASCAEAASWLDAHTPDMVMVDINLRDGVCSAVVARLVKRDIPFVIYSGDSPSCHAGTPFLKGIWVEKPATPHQLLQAVRKALAGTAKAKVAPGSGLDWRARYRRGSAASSYEVRVPAAA